MIQEVSPYAALMTGPTTVANLFGHMGGRAKGLVQIWDVVRFDEVADLEKMPKEVITTMKTYCCESGSFQRGQEAAFMPTISATQINSGFISSPFTGASFE